ncbi:MAG: agmatinase [Archaeoglobus sp.]|nr:agmatinase [Archaeoglobus sp.]
MHIDSYFSLSNSTLDKAEYVIFGIPYDATQSFKPGSRFAPNAIREASWNLESYSMYFDFDLSFSKIYDAGNINVDGDFSQIQERTSDFLSKTKAFPIALGGEHTISFACLQNFRNVCYLTLDAHLDLRDEFDGSRFNHACTVRRVYERYEKGDIERVIQLGVRSGTAEERDFARKKGIEVYYAWDLMEDIDWVFRRLENYDRIYLSLDMDVFDPSYAPGVSTPEPFGLNPIHFLRLVEELADRIVGFDLVEVVPDSNKITQTLAAKLVCELISAIESSL